MGCAHAVTAIRHAAFLGWCLGGWVWPVAAQAPASPALERGSAQTQLSWSRGEGASDCLSEADLVEAVESRLERAVFAPEGPVRIAGRVERQEDEIVVRLSLSHRGDPVGERTLRSAVGNCRLLDASIAVVLALLVEVGQSEIALRAPVPPAIPEERPRLRRSPRPEERPSSPRGPRWGAVVEAGAQGMVGVLPEASLGLLAGAEVVSPSPVSVRAELLVGPEGEAALGGGRRGRFGFWAAGLAGCLDAAWVPSVELGGCVGARLGELTGQGFGFDDNTRGSIVWVSLTGRLRARVGVPLEGGSLLFVGLSIGIEVPLSPSVFRAAPLGRPMVVHDPEPLVPTATLSFGARIR